ncbi:MAG TPA: hypothetical protein VH601_14395 [Bryobacteraceae bacterium]|jgi:hypothetical protein
MSFGSVCDRGLLIDTNLLVLFAVGSVNRDRIETFKRTRRYTAEDFDLLLRVLGNWGVRYTTPHVLAEVSNLTDLAGTERPVVLKRRSRVPVPLRIRCIRVSGSPMQELQRLRASTSAPS